MKKNFKKYGMKVHFIEKYNEYQKSKYMSFLKFDELLEKHGLNILKICYYKMISNIYKRNLK